MEWRLELFLFLSFPGRLWVWICGLMLGFEVIEETEVESDSRP